MDYDQYVENLKKMYVERAVKQALSRIISKLPFLSFGPFAYILEYFITKLLTWTVEESEVAIFFKYIDIRTDQQGNDLYRAMERHEKAKLGNNEQESKDAENNLKSAFRDFVKFTN